MEALDREEPIQQRLRFAYQKYLVALRPDDLPEHKQEDFKALQEGCTWIPAEPNQQGTIDSTFAQMSAQEAERWASHNA